MFFFLKIGDQVPTDGLFIDGHSLQVNESSVTDQRNTKNEDGTIEFLAGKTKFHDAITSMVRLMVVEVTIIVTIPKGLPLFITLTLGYTVKRIMAYGVMVQNPSVCETMGSEFEFSGKPFEKEILSWAVQELNMDLEELKQNYTILHVEPFNSTTKRSGISIRKMVDSMVNVHWKVGMATGWGRGSPSPSLIPDGGNSPVPGLYPRRGTHYRPLTGSAPDDDDDDDERHEIDQIIQGLGSTSLSSGGYSFLAFFFLEIEL
ncbi:hypothetical protein TEA_007758 [Camellia sinensis var. sinensis]|uniref:Cation-transporting P-type ATPase N-terminal domain-containing protein n=1 Tax=Camellia sinensis var. sinensis TaxID=542762 RepID=A0A4S4DWX5_CAMSN|nr:hypothetical protein TEA_007758 [Camellia sinensis var. sinensis]